MPVTPENSRLNLRTAARNVRARLGLPESPLSWSYDQRAAYNGALAAEILAYPGSFTPETLATAQRVSGLSYGALADASFSWGELAGETAANAAPILTQTRWILWGVIALAVLILLFRLGPRGPRAV